MFCAQCHIIIESTVVCSCCIISFFALCAVFTKVLLLKVLPCILCVVDKSTHVRACVIDRRFFDAVWESGTNNST